LARIFKELEKKIKPNIRTKDLEIYAESLMKKEKVRPSFKGYENFPSAICTSINEEIVHTPPSSRKIKEGDLLKIDIGINYKGFHLDKAKTYPINKVSFESLRLLKVAKKALKLGIKKARVGNTIGDISNTIQRYVESQGFNVIKELFGHGIGRNLHEEPIIPNFGKRKKGPKILEGMVICIEPMISMGDPKLEKTEDGFGFRTRDKSLTAHFEDTIAILKKGPINLTSL
jgi:methionyl aminopeptidase